MPVVVFAQDENTLIKIKNPNRAFYTGFGGGPANQKGAYTLSLSGNAILTNDRYGVSFSYMTYFNEKAKFLPKDYIPTGWFCFGDCLPSDQTDMYSLRWIIEPHNTKKSVRLGWEMGPSWVVYKEANFTPSKGGGIGAIFPEPNYGINYIHSQTLGFSLRGKISFLLPVIFGLEIAAHANINKYQSVIGIEIHSLLGYFGKL